MSESSTSRQRWHRLESLFHAASELPRSERDAFLARECGDDAALRNELLALLAAEDGSPAFLTPTTPQAFAPRRVGPWLLERVLGEGGMGVVYLARRADDSFDKQVAIKLLRPGLVAADWLARFDGERRVLARLEHPGIARLIDAGRDEHGAPFFAMEYVEGERIDRWCDARGLDVRGRVELLARVARAVEHAHRALVVHRDLKPANVLVDARGEPRLLDFGIAKALDAQPEALELTRTGERPLTPAYASPEQLSGAPVRLESDVWSLGIVLHELLTGLHPHRKETRTRAELELAVQNELVDLPSRFARAEVEGQASARERAELRGTTPSGLERQLRGDLDRIVGMALRKEPERRYRSAEELAGDLERWLQGRPVLASGDGLGYRASRALRRHPIEFALAGTLAVALLVFAVLYVRQSLRDRDQISRIRRLSDLERYDRIVAAADEPVPMVPSEAARFAEWAADARALVARSAEHRATLAELRAEDLSGRDDDERRWHGMHVERLEQLLAGLDALARPEPHGATIAMFERRARIAATLSETSLVEAAEAWREAQLAVSAHSDYGGLQLAPQLGLVPLGPDARSGLWEFWHVASGARPERNPDGRIGLREGDGLVFVLVPGGLALFGAQRDDPSAPNYDPQAERDEQPVKRVQLDPFFLSKYEVTQAQWFAWTHENPSKNPAGTRFRDEVYTPQQPVEQISWLSSSRELARLDLVIPTEAQWEYACRAGTTTAWFSGPEEASLAGYANLADRFAREHGAPSSWVFADWVDDGYVNAAPVGSYAPNRFGLHDMAGNVWELTRDSVDPRGGGPRAGDGLHSEAATPDVISRGGAFRNTAFSLRSSERYSFARDLGSWMGGLRPARPVRP
ncbi:MAG: hypothetical protein FJ299_00960 [Planctomycetes bacterium]|nr:hypothetical protein [Planctomycetota bacterium]